MRFPPTPHLQAPPDYTPLSGGSLRQLRADMLIQAAVMGTRARNARLQGYLHRAQALDSRAERLVEIARSVNVSRHEN